MTTVQSDCQADHVRAYSWPLFEGGGVLAGSDLWFGKVPASRPLLPRLLPVEELEGLCFPVHTILVVGAIPDPVEELERRN